jgi:hypothetical protein
VLAKGDAQKAADGEVGQRYLSRVDIFDEQRECVKGFVCGLACCHDMENHPHITQEETMTRIRGVWLWQRIVSTHLPCLSRPQVATLALWSLGIILIQSA